VTERGTALSDKDGDTNGWLLIDGRFVTRNQIVCPLPTDGQPPHSLDGSTSWMVSVSNNGVLRSPGHLFVPHDDVCFDCVHTRNDDVGVGLNAIAVCRRKEVNHYARAVPRNS
jgi:hypothetical protein